MLLYANKVNLNTNCYHISLGNSRFISQFALREDIKEKKRFLSGIAGITLTPPPPHDPNSGNLVLFFRTSKFKI